MKAAITLVLAQLGLVAVAVAAGPASADPYRLHHDYYKLIATKGAGTQSQTGASHTFPWSSIGVGLAVAVLAGLLLVVVLKVTRRGHMTAV